MPIFQWTLTYRRGQVWSYTSERKKLQTRGCHHTSIGPSVCGLSSLSLGDTVLQRNLSLRHDWSLQWQIVPNLMFCLHNSTRRHDLSLRHDWSFGVTNRQIWCSVHTIWHSDTICHIGATNRAKRVYSVNNLLPLRQHYYNLFSPTLSISSSSFSFFSVGHWDAEVKLRWSLLRNQRCKSFSF